MTLHRCVDGRATLLAHELHYVVRPASSLPARSRSLPPGERLRTGPRARRGTCALVGVADARFDLVEEARDLRVAAAVDPRREPVLGAIALGDRLLEGVDLADHEQRREELRAKERTVERQHRDRWRNIVPLRLRSARQARATHDDLALCFRLRNRALVANHRSLVDHRPEIHIARRRIADHELLALRD